MIRQLLIGSGMALVLLVTMQPATAQHGTSSPIIGNYFRMALAGDLSAANEMFEVNPDDPGTHQLKGQFQARFVDRANGLDLSKIDSPRVREVMDIFETYWLDALLGTAPLEQLEEALLERLDVILTDEGYPTIPPYDDDYEDAITKNVERFFRAEGYFALSGRTQPLLELMVWISNEVNHLSVELTDGIYEMDVTFLDDFVSYGWINYATFGMSSTGGWATREGLNCLCGHYDLNSERYQVSYLKHEGRHFADYSLYPELQASDLEYRAKLTELAYSEQDMYGRLTEFTNGAMKIENAAHPLANWYVINRLSDRFLDGQMPSSATAWEAISKDDIRAAAMVLLTEHDEALIREGALTTKGVILP